jgi:hypothetical protein
MRSVDGRRGLKLAGAGEPSKRSEAAALDAATEVAVPRNGRAERVNRSNTMAAAIAAQRRVRAASTRAINEGARSHYQLVEGLIAQEVRAHRRAARERLPTVPRRTCSNGTRRPPGRRRRRVVSRSAGGGDPSSAAPGERPRHHELDDDDQQARSPIARAPAQFWRAVRDAIEAREAAARSRVVG